MEENSREKIRRLVGEAVGEASMCWEPRPSYHCFDSDRAVKVIDRLTKALEKNAQSHKTFCKRCGKAHVPVCDRCKRKLGEGPDFRSLHGPCDKCAFPEKVKQAFQDELRKIAATAPRGFFLNLGGRILQNVNQGARRLGAGTAEFLGDIGGDTVGAVGDMFTAPIQAARAGWAKSWSVPQSPSLWSKTKSVGANALTLTGTAIPVAMAVPETDPSGRGESRLTRGIRAGIGGYTGLAASKRGVGASLILGSAGDYAGGVIGRAIDKKRGFVPKRPPPQLQPQLQPQVAPEVVQP